MESLAGFPNGEWDSFNKFFSIEDQFGFSEQILPLFSFPLEHDEGLSFIKPSSFFPNPEVSEIFLPSSNALDSSFHYDSLETYDLTGSNHIAVRNDITMSLDISMDNGGVSDKMTNSFHPAFPNIAMEGAVNVIEDLSTDVVLANNELLLKGRFDALELHAEGDQINSTSTENTKKRPRASRVYKNVQYSKKNRKNNVNVSEGECNTVVDHGHSSSTTFSSEDDNVSQDINGVATSDSKGSQALNLNGKTRASRGSATDPQSLYARKRRERINERLRILQNLVPNGTKVDISTMLEEAALYVKFLQLQIKLLSSDDIRMYAPIFYNGVDVGLNEKISTQL